MEIEDSDNKINSTNENANIRQKRVIILLILIVLLATISCSIFTRESERDPTWPQQTGTSIKATELALRKTQDFYISTEERGTYRPTITAFWATEGLKLTQNAISLNQTESAIRATQVAISTAQEATNIVERENYYNGLDTATARAIPKPPVINKIDFPALIPKTGEVIRGTLYFSDQNGDVVSQNVEVVSATGSGFTGRTRDITKRLVSGTWYNGAIFIAFLCYENQDVTVRMTLIDSKGNVSNPKTFSFSCR